MPGQILVLIISPEVVDFQEDSLTNDGLFNKRNMECRVVPTVVGSDRYRPPLRKNSHHSDKIATTTNSLTSTKIST